YRAGLNLFFSFNVGFSTKFQENMAKRERKRQTQQQNNHSVPLFGWQEVDQSLLDRESEQIDPVGIIAIPQKARKGESSSTNVDDDVCQRQEARDNKRRKGKSDESDK